MDNNQKAKDLSFLLPFIGLLLLSPLVLAVADAKSSVFGLPSLPIFIFAIWLCLIFSSFLLTRKLKNYLKDEQPASVKSNLATEEDVS